MQQKNKSNIYKYIFERHLETKQQKLYLKLYSRIN